MSKVIYIQLTPEHIRNPEIALFDLAPLMRTLYNQLNPQTRFSITLHTICKSRSGIKFGKIFQSSIHYPRSEQKFCSCLFEIFAGLSHDIRFQQDYSRLYKLESVDFNIEPNI